MRGEALRVLDAVKGRIRGLFSAPTDGVVHNELIGLRKRAAEGTVFPAFCVTWIQAMTPAADEFQDFF
jgi:hypothetical protein